MRDRLLVRVAAAFYADAARTGADLGATDQRLVGGELELGRTGDAPVAQRAEQILQRDASLYALGAAGDRRWRG